MYNLICFEKNDIMNTTVCSKVDLVGCETNLVKIYVLAYFSLIKLMDFFDRFD